MEPFSLQAKLAELKDLKETESALSERYEAAKADRKILELQLYEYMMDRQIKSMKLKGIGSFTAQATVTGYIESGGMEAFMDWCRRTGNEDIFLQVKHRGAPLNELVRTSLASGEDLPPGVAPKETPFISIRKG